VAVKGATTEGVFEANVEIILSPMLCPGQAVVMDDLTAHRGDDLADCGHPPPQALKLSLLAAVALGRVVDAHSVATEPTPMVFFALEALVGHIGSYDRRSHARKSRARSMLDGEKVSATCWLVAEAKDKPKPMVRPVGSVATINAHKACNQATTAS
jgi:hypothetical protein